MPRTYGPKHIDMTGQVFDRLTVIRFVGCNGSGVAVWLCRCSCDGKEIEVPRRNLLHPTSPKRSCGCLRRETSKSNMQALNEQMRIRRDNEQEQEHPAESG